MSKSQFKHAPAWATDAEERRAVEKERQRWAPAPEPLDKVCHKRPRWTGSACREETP